MKELKIKFSKEELKQLLKGESIEMDITKKELKEVVLFIFKMDKEL